MGGDIKKNMEQEPTIGSASEGEIKIVDGKKYRRVDSGYTLRQYFSHESIEKGPGPGWDFRRDILEEHGVNEPSELPDEPYYQWELIEDEK